MVAGIRCWDADRRGSLGRVGEYTRRPNRSLGVTSRCDRRGRCVGVIIGMGRWDVDGKDCRDAMSNGREDPPATPWVHWEMTNHVWVIVD